MSDVTDFPAAHIGTPSFIPTLLTYVRNGAAGLPIEPVIFQSLLLCLISGNKHLILRTAEEDVGLVVKLTVKTLATVFGILTHRLRIHRRTELSDFSTVSGISTFLRSLFIPASGSTSHFGHDETQTLTSHGPKKHRKRPSSGSRSLSATVRSLGSQYTKSVSYPNDITSAKSFNIAPSILLSPSDPFGDRQSPSMAGIPSHNSLNSASRTSSYSAMPHPTFPHSYSDPTPFRSVRDPSQMQLPSALVISGLENASLASQRALTTVLNEGQVVLNDVSNPNEVDLRQRAHRHSKLTFETDAELSGVWPLPQDFILVYVCPLDERERPAIHYPLLQKFAMSATVSLHPTIRSMSKNFFRPVSHRSSPILSPVPQVATYPPNSTPPFLAQPLPQRHISPGVMTPSNGSHTVITPEAMKLLKEIYSKVHLPSTLNLYVNDLFSAARHHHQLEGRLLSIAAINDALDLSRAARVLGGDPTGLELIDGILNTDDDKLDDSSTADGGASGDGRLSKAMTDIGSAYVVIDPLEMRLPTEEGRESLNEVAIPILDVTQADIARIVPRVLSHRLRVRDGPEDEVLAGAIFGASFSASLQKDERGRKVDRDRGRVTVKDLLIGILQDV
ncbi:hypothetical protein GYMLUDRAFT_35132 [Collybiopsis luxurians FD-317 M1]|nr:hypothetical protein GYMLUDRAFT_35132 [Collybiopsis luxurians FD-317 M1]